MAGQAEATHVRVLLVRRTLTNLVKEPLMSPQDVLEILRAQPFEPFELQLSTGERFEVHHPENLLVGRTKCYLPVLQDGIVERMVHMALVHIVKIELLNRPKLRRRQRKTK